MYLSNYLKIKKSIPGSLYRFFNLLVEVGHQYNNYGPSNKIINDYRDERRQKGEYNYIPTDPNRIVIILALLDKLMKKKNESLQYPKTSFNIVDLGSGTGAFLAILKNIIESFNGLITASYIRTKGIEIFDGLGHYFISTDFKSILDLDKVDLVNFDFIYAYNPFEDPKLMLKALKHWMEVKPDNCTIIYNRVSSFRNIKGGEEWFNKNFTNVQKPEGFPSCKGCKRRKVNTSIFISNS